MTDDERAELDAELAASSDLVGTVIGWGVLAALAGAALGAIGFGVGSLFAYPGAGIGLAVGGGLGIGVVALMVIACERDARAQRRVLAAELARGTVIEIRVTDAEVTEDGAGPDFTDHQLVVDLDASRVLLISRNAVFRDASIIDPDPREPGVPPAEGCEDACWNGLAPPHVFPARSFVLRGLERSGRILRITIDGASIPVERDVVLGSVPFIGYRRDFLVAERTREEHHPT